MNTLEILIKEHFITLMLVINTFSFTLMGLDKRKAIKHKFRIPELTFFLLSCIGGYLGIIIGGIAFKHKTSKLSFKIKVWIGMMINILALF